MEIIYGERVSEFIKDLPDKYADRVRRTTYLLMEHGHLLRMPYSKALGRGLFELRIVGALHIRLLYIYHKNKAFMLHALIKKQGSLDPKDIKIARNAAREVVV